MEAPVLVLELNVKMLKFMGLWPEQESKILYALQILLIYGNMGLCAYACTMGTFRQLFYGVDDLEGIVEGGIGVLDSFGMIYMAYCFMTRIDRIKAMLNTIREFRQFCPLMVIADAESKARKYSKWFYVYAFVGNILNFTMSVMGWPSCSETRNPVLAKRDPCGTTIRGYWPMDIDTPLLQWFAIIVDLQACIVISFVAFAITTFLIGSLVHTIHQLEHCRTLLKDSCKSGNKDAGECVRFCIRYHQKIIEFSEAINENFSPQMMLHVTVTSVVISILGFQILTVNSFEHSFRFSLHLFGWSFFLYVTCFFAQKLIDESLLVSLDAYSTPWFNKPVTVQKSLKMIIMRAQKPLTLSAVNLGIMSLGMFLMIMKSAYSYFTLFLNLRQ